MNSTIIRRFKNGGSQNGFAVSSIVEVFGYPILQLAKFSSPKKPNIYLSAGIHGDEPAPVTALLHLIETGYFDDRANWQIHPILNPSGLVAGTRENADGIDLNRDFHNTTSTEIQALIKNIKESGHPDLSLSLHEDWEASGFYLYAIHDRHAESVGKNVLDAVCKVGPIESQLKIDGHPSNNGLILPLQFIDDDSLAEGWPEAIFLYRRSQHLHMTLESPSGLPEKKRVLMHRVAIETAVNQCLKIC